MAEKQLVVFRLGEEEYGIDILAVKEIIRYRKTVKLPDCPDFLDGIINYRDSIVPILDLNRRFKLGERGRGCHKGDYCRYRGTGGSPSGVHGGSGRRGVKA